METSLSFLYRAPLTSFIGPSHQWLCSLESERPVPGKRWLSHFKDETKPGRLATQRTAFRRQSLRSRFETVPSCSSPLLRLPIERERPIGLPLSRTCAPLPRPRMSQAQTTTLSGQPGSGSQNNRTATRSSVSRGVGAAHSPIHCKRRPQRSEY